MMKRFAQMSADGKVVNIIMAEADEFGSFIDVTDRDDVQVGSDYDPDADSYSEPAPGMLELVKALVITIKANPGVTVPPKALAIFKRFKDELA